MGRSQSGRRNVCFWHMTAFAAAHHLGRDWTTTDKGRAGSLIDMQRLTHIGHSTEVSRNYDVPYANDCSRPFSHFGERSAA
jgi:hypothetical protein